MYNFLKLHYNFLKLHSFEEQLYSNQLSENKSFWLKVAPKWTLTNELLNIIKLNNMIKPTIRLMDQNESPIYKSKTI